MHMQTCVRVHYIAFIYHLGKLQANDKLHGYTVTSVTAVPDFDLTAVCLTHDSTGAQHLHVARNDSNNTFR